VVEEDDGQLRRHPRQPPCLPALPLSRPPAGGQRKQPTTTVSPSPSAANSQIAPRLPAQSQIKLPYEAGSKRSVERRIRACNVPTLLVLCRCSDFDLMHMGRQQQQLSVTQKHCSKEHCSQEHCSPRKIPRTCKVPVKNR